MLKKFLFVNHTLTECLGDGDTLQDGDEREDDDSGAQAGGHLREGHGPVALHSGERWQAERREPGPHVTCCST